MMEWCGKKRVGNRKHKTHKHNDYIIKCCDFCEPWRFLCEEGITLNTHILPSVTYSEMLLRNTFYSKSIFEFRCCYKIEACPKERVLSYFCLCNIEFKTRKQVDKI